LDFRRLFDLLNLLLSILSGLGPLLHEVTLLGEVVFSTVVTLFTGLLVRVVADTHTSVVPATWDRFLWAGFGLALTSTFVLG